MAGASQPSAWKNFCDFFHFCGTIIKHSVGQQMGNHRNFVILQAKFYVL